MGSDKQEDRVMLKSHRLLILLCLALLCSLSFNAEAQTPFSFRENNQGVELLESGRPVFFYQREPKSLTGKYICNNYIHPLYSISGDTLTEEFPADHPYHRGVYWAWHQIYIGNQSVGDGWVMQNISEDVAKLRTKVQDSTATLDIDVNWKSSAWQTGNSIVYEHTYIVVHSLSSGIRIIDFEISLKALVPEVSIGGSDDEKGYGGFCLRIKLPEDLVFTSVNGPVIPQTLQIKSGPWMDFSGSFGLNDKKSGLTLICSPATPNYPAPWILRQVTSMQNVVFPGRQRINLPTGKLIVLKYRLIVHKGKAGDVNIAKLQGEYE
jgi:hypothetical protein